MRSYATLDPATGLLAAEQAPQSAPGPAGEHPDLAEHDALGLATDTALTSHANAASHTDARTPLAHAHADGDLPAGLARDAEVAATYALIHAHPYAATSHAHVDGDLPAGLARDAEVAATYAPIHAHPYEASGAVAAHAALGDPHSGYLTPAEGSAAYEASGAVAAHALTPHGGGTWTTIIKTADESKNATAAVADDALLKFTTLPNTNYTIRLRAFFLTNATADLKYRLVHGGTTTRVRRAITRTATGDVPAHITTGTAFDGADVILSTTGLNPYLAEEVILQVGASGGLFVLRWSQVTSNPGPTTCLEGSYLEYAVT